MVDPVPMKWKLQWVRGMTSRWVPGLLFLTWFFLSFNLSSVRAARLILLNGASCSGKSTLARALVQALEGADESEVLGGESWQMASIDVFWRESMCLLPEGGAAGGEGKEAIDSINHFRSKEPEILAGKQGSSDQARLGLAVKGEDCNPHPIPPAYWGRISELSKIYDRFHRQVRALLDGGQSVILDHCLAHDGIFKNALYHFQDVAVLFVQLPLQDEVAFERLKIRNQEAVLGQAPVDPRECRRESALLFHLGKAPLYPPLRKSYYRQLSGADQLRYPASQLCCKGLATHRDKTYSLVLAERSSVEERVAQVLAALKELSLEDRSFFCSHQSEWARVRRARVEVDPEKRCFVERETSSYQDDYL